MKGFRIRIRGDSTSPQQEPQLDAGQIHVSDDVHSNSRRKRPLSSHVESQASQHSSNSSSSLKKYGAPKHQEKRNKLTCRSDEAHRFLTEWLSKLRKKDSKQYFWSPVDGSIVPDYYDIIKNPMDFNTMEGKIHNGGITDCTSFEGHLKLIIDNCKLYNAAHTPFVKSANLLESWWQKSRNRFIYHFDSLVCKATTDKRNETYTNSSRAEPYPNIPLREPYPSSDPTTRQAAVLPPHSDPITQMTGAMTNEPSQPKGSATTSQTFQNNPNLPIQPGVSKMFSHHNLITGKSQGLTSIPSQATHPTASNQIPNRLPIIATNRANTIPVQVQHHQSQQPSHIYSANRQLLHHPAIMNEGAPKDMSMHPYNPSTNPTCLDDASSWNANQRAHMEQMTYINSGYDKYKTQFSSKTQSDIRMQSMTLNPQFKCLKDIMRLPNSDALLRGKIIPIIRIRRELTRLCHLFDAHFLGPGPSASSWSDNDERDSEASIKNFIGALNLDRLARLNISLPLSDDAKTSRSKLNKNQNPEIDKNKNLTTVDV